MLILTRRSGEAINIGANVELTVLEVSGDHVRLGIRAPRDILVLRGELREEVERENRLAASPQGKLGLKLVGSLTLSSRRAVSGSVLVASTGPPNGTSVPGGGP